MEPEETLKDKQQHLETWLERTRQNQKLIPHVNDELERTKWEIEVVQKFKSRLGGVPLPTNVNAAIEQSYEITKNELPLPPQYSQSAFISLSTAGTAAASQVYDFISQPVPLTDYDFTSQIIDYQNLQHKQNRPSETLERIKAINYPLLEDRFEKAQKAYNDYKAGTMSNSATASEIRNLLHSIDGYLFAKARTKNEQKLKWEDYAQRLAIYLMPNHLYQEIIRQGTIHNELIQILSPGAKDRTSVNIDDVWTRVLDHIFIVLGSIKR